MIVGVIGKANTGKSTFFKASTLMNVEIANYPFATVKPNHGIGFVKIDCADKDFQTNCNPRLGYCKNNKRFIPIDMIDVAGLVPGAHEGKGMGLEFLNDLNQANALIHVIDVAGTTNEKGEPIEPGSYDPAEDIKFLENELDHWYLNILKKPWDKFARQTIQEQTEIAKAINRQFTGLGANEEMISEILSRLDLKEKILTQWSPGERFQFARKLRIMTKPMIIAANKIDVKGAYENFERLKKQFPDLIIIPCSSESELALKEAEKHQLVEYIPGEKNFETTGQPSDRQKSALEFINNNVLNKYRTTGVQEVLNETVFNLLKLIAAYPVANNRLQDKDGNTLPDCFLIPENSNALDFAFKVHTDLGENFIRAIDLRTKMTVGRDHEIKHRDVVEIIADK
jgi:ribosome-binding ATPase YchF (GTP1/OBG family)